MELHPASCRRSDSKESMTQYLKLTRWGMCQTFLYVVCMFSLVFIATSGYIVIWLTKNPRTLSLGLNDNNSNCRNWSNYSNHNDNNNINNKSVTSNSNNNSSQVVIMNLNTSNTTVDWQLLHCLGKWIMDFNSLGGRNEDVDTLFNYNLWEHWFDFLFL